MNGTLPIVLDPITRRKLVLVKELYNHAVGHCGHPTHMSKILAVIAFDLSTETMLRAMVSALNPKKQPSDTFQGLIHECETLLPLAGIPQLPDKANIQYVHGIRNDAQHKVRYPNEIEVSDARAYTRDFLKKVTIAVWNVNFLELSLVDLVQHVKVKEFFSAAERAYFEGDYRRAVQEAGTALKFSLLMVQKAVVGQFPSFIDGVMTVDSSGRSRSDSNNRSMFQALQRMQDVLLYVVLGLNRTDLGRIFQITGSIQLSIDGTPTFFWGKETVSPAEAEFVIARAIDNVITVEEVVGDIERPFQSVQE